MTPGWATAGRERLGDFARHGDVLEFPKSRWGVPGSVRLPLAAISEKYDKIWHIQFENGKVTMWGEPGDLNYSSTISSGQSFPVFDPKREQ